MSAPSKPSREPDATQFKSHMWKFGAPSRQTEAEAAAWATLAEQLQNDSPEKWFGLFGGSKQLDLTQLSTHRVLCDRTISSARSLLAKEGVDSHGRLHVAAMKLLQLKPGDGPQLVHYDTLDRDEAELRFSFLLYCTCGVSTWAPRLSHAEMQHLFLKGETMSDKERATAKRMCVPENFINYPTTPGNTLIFRTDVAHYGPKNETADMRYAVYILFSPTSQKENPKQDDEQRLPLGLPAGKSKNY